VLARVLNACLQTFLMTYRAFVSHQCPCLQWVRIKCTSVQVGALWVHWRSITRRCKGSETREWKSGSRRYQLTFDGYPQPCVVDKLGTTFAALSDPTRRAMIELLCRLTHSRRLGDRGRSHPSTSEVTLAHDRLRSSGMDGCRGTDSRKPDRHPGRTRTYPHELCPLPIDPERTRRLGSGTVHPLARGLAVFAFENPDSEIESFLIVKSTTSITYRTFWSSGSAKK
jgi:hypothetical protein